MQPRVVRIVAPPNLFAITGLVMGLLGLALAITTFVTFDLFARDYEQQWSRLSLLAALLGATLAAIGLNTARRTGQGLEMAIGGLCGGILGSIIGVLPFLLFGLGGATLVGP